MATTHGIRMLVPGGTGQLGRDLAALTGDDVWVRAPGSAELDVTSTGTVLREVDELAAGARQSGGFPVVVNAAAYTAVDAAEDDESSAFAVNADGPRVLAAACAARRVPLLHLSTDYVFSGEQHSPYEADDVPAPRTAYGRTKTAGEHAVRASGARAWIVRTAWVYGAAGDNFVNTMLRLERERSTVSVVDDQHGSPTWTADLAAALLELAHRISMGAAPERDILHCAGGGEATWYSFARAIFSGVGADPERVQPCDSSAFPRPAARPAYSVLSTTSWTDAGLTAPRPWQQALTEFLG